MMDHKITWSNSETHSRDSLMMLKLVIEMSLAECRWQNLLVSRVCKSPSLRKCNREEVEKNGREDHENGSNVEGDIPSRFSVHLQTGHQSFANSYITDLRQNLATNQPSLEPRTPSQTTSCCRGRRLWPKYLGPFQRLSACPRRNCSRGSTSSWWREWQLLFYCHQPEWLEWTLKPALEEL